MKERENEKKQGIAMRKKMLQKNFFRVAGFTVSEQERNFFDCLTFSRLMALQLLFFFLEGIHN